MSNADKNNLNSESSVFDEINHQSENENHHEGGEALHENDHHLNEGEVHDVESRPKKVGSKLPVYIALGAIGIGALGLAGFFLSTVFMPKSSGESVAMQQMDKPLDMSPPVKQVVIPGMTDLPVATVAIAPMGLSTAGVPLAPVSAPLTALVTLPVTPTGSPAPVAPLIAVVVEQPIIKPIQATPVVVAEASPSKKQPLKYKTAAAKPMKADPYEEIINSPKKKAHLVRRTHATAKLNKSIKAPQFVPAGKPETEFMEPFVPNSAVMTPVITPEEPYQLLAVSPAAGGFPLAHLKRTSDGRTLVVRVGDSLPNGAKVKSINSTDWLVETTFGAIR